MEDVETWEKCWMARGFFEGFVGLLEETYLHILFWVMICEKASPRKSQETNLAPFVLAASRQM